MCACIPPQSIQYMQLQLLLKPSFAARDRTLCNYTEWGASKWLVYPFRMVSNEYHNNNSSSNSNNKSCNKSSNKLQLQQQQQQQVVTMTTAAPDNYIDNRNNDNNNDTKQQVPRQAQSSKPPTCHVDKRIPKFHAREQSVNPNVILPSLA